MIVSPSVTVLRVPCVVLCFLKSSHPNSIKSDRSPEGQRSLSDQGSRVFLRDGLLAKQTASRKEAEVGKIASDLAKVARETLDALHHRDVVDHRSLRVALEERNNNKAPGSIAREDYRRREKVHTSLGFVFATLTGSYQ